MVRVVNITEAKAQLSRLVDQAQAGERIIIGRAGKPAAILQAYETDPEPRRLGGWAGRVWIAEDFDDPLPTHSIGCSSHRASRRSSHS